MTRPILLTGREKRSFSLFSVLVSVLLVLIFAFFFFEMWFLGRFTPVCVDGRSMLMTLEDGDWLYADSEEPPERGDIVIIYVKEYTDEDGHALFSSEANREPITYIIKRVIALEGDEIYCSGNQVYLKKQGEAEFTCLTEPYAYYDPTCAPLYFGNALHPIEVGEGEMFVMGDNRLHSNDSTEIGTLLTKDVTGVVPVWALEHKGAITRWENFRDRFRN